MANPIVTIQMKDGGVMKAELYPDIAPVRRRKSPKRKKRSSCPSKDFPILTTEVM